MIQWELRTDIRRTDLCPVSLLPNNWLRDDDNNQLYEVDKILDRRQRGRSKGYEYFVSWKGCEAVDNCWIPAKNFEGNDAKAMRKAFDNTCS